MEKIQAVDLYLSAFDYRENHYFVQFVAYSAYQVFDSKTKVTENFIRKPFALRLRPSGKKNEPVVFDKKLRLLIENNPHQLLFLAIWRNRYHATRCCGKNLMIRAEMTLLINNSI